MMSRYEKAIDNETDFGVSLVSERWGRSGYVVNWYALKRFAYMITEKYGRLVNSKYGKKSDDDYTLSKSFRSCCEVLLPEHVDSNLRQAGKHEPYKLTDWMHCGSRTCPACGYRLAVSDVGEVSRAVLDWAYWDGDYRCPRENRSCLLLCLTCSHTKSERLLDVYKDNVQARKLFLADRAVRDAFESMGVTVFVVCVETPHGDNGWHYHPHILLFCDRSIDDDERAHFESILKPVWARMVEKVGRTQKSAYGLKLSGGSAVKTYLGKQALELAFGNYGKDSGGYSHLKTPASILFDCASTYHVCEKQFGGIKNAPGVLVNAWLYDVSRWVEWRLVMSGTRFLRWSPNAKDYFPHLKEDERKMEDFENVGVDVLKILDARNLTRRLNVWQLFKLQCFGLRNDMQGAVDYLRDFGFDSVPLVDGSPWITKGE